MVTAWELYRQGRKREIWDTYCGFLDLSVQEFMALQRKHLEEQLPRYAESRLGQRILHGRTPRTLEEFRATVPFTTYKDYAPFLLARDEESLPEKPRAWGHTSGQSGEYDFKWIPITQRMYEQIGESALSSFILSAAREKGDVVLSEGMTFPYTIAPPPYITGIGAQRLLELFPFRSFPSLDRVVGMDFPSRMQEALASALSEGMDYFFGITSILLKISENFGKLGRGGPPVRGCT